MCKSDFWFSQLPVQFHHWNVDILHDCGIQNISVSLRETAIHLSISIPFFVLSKPHILTCYIYLSSRKET